MNEHCIETEIGRKIKLLDYSFNKINPERQKAYRQHLNDCAYCKDQAVRASAKRRLKGVINISGGLGLCLIAPFIPIPFVPLVFVLAGLAWIIIGIWRLISGKD